MLFNYLNLDVIRFIRIFMLFGLSMQMKGEQTLLQKLFDTEIAMLRAMRDGSAVMQHMEDFYYITLLQVQLLTE